MAQRQLGGVVQHIRKLVSAAGARELTDPQLLERFATGRDETTFAALVQRHGRLVWSVCWQVLHHEQDAEDAFQATFLILARQAGSIRRAQTVPSWLYRVAQRTALAAQKAKAIRRGHETRAATMRRSNPPADSTWGDLQALLTAEINRLAEKYRAPFLLCCLEGKSKTEAAKELGWKEGTVSGRLARARKQLRDRLARRGVALSSLLGAVALANDATAAVPALLVSSTVKAALEYTAGKSVGMISTEVAALVQGATKAMFATKLKLGAAFFLVMSIVATGGAVTHSLLAARDEGRLQLVSERRSEPQARQSAEAAPEEISQVATPSDEQTLKESKIGGDGPALLEFLRRRTLAAQENNVASLVQKLGDSSFAIREKATAELAAVGTPAVALLRQAAKGTDAEAARRAGGCLRRIQGGREGALPAAVVRLVAARRPAGAAEALLNYLPVAYDDYVAEEARYCLAAVAQVNGKLERVLVDALSDRQSAARRAFAGEAICRAVGADQRQPVRKLLQDSVPGVRLRIALALATRKDRDAIPTLVEVLDKVPPAQARQAEDLLYRLAEEKGPDLPFAAEEGSWGRRREAWTAWWRQHGPQVDLARLHMPANTLIVESSPGDKTTLVFEQAPDGKILWQLRPGSTVTDALVVPGRRVLLSEWTNLCVTERDFDGVILWKKRLATNPLFLQRLPDGHTFILDQEQVLEVDQAGKEVFHYKPANHIRRILAAQKLRDGQIACFTYEGLIDPEGFPTSTYISRLDVNGKELKQCLIARNKKTKRDINDSIDFGGMDALANGHVLIAHHVSGRVVEYDGEGQAVWDAKVPWPAAPKRQLNGNTRVVIGVGANEKERGLVELDRAGKTIWKVAVELPGPSTHLSNGHTLLIRHLFNPSGGRLLEIDRAGKVVWQYETKGGLSRARR